MERRLAAILSADIVGYTRLVRHDEEGTVTRVRAQRDAVIDPKIAEYRGRIVKELGDGLLVEFSSVVDAVRCAIDTQRAIKAGSAADTDAPPIVYRIGINLGDVIVAGDDIHGDGVNIATRMQEVAPPGGISVSGIVFDSVKDKLSPFFEDLGPQNVKNVEEPVRAYRVLIDPEAEGRPGTRPADADFDGRESSHRTRSRASHVPPNDSVPPRGRIISFLSGVERNGAWTVPRELEVVSLMGAVELDFAEAQLGPGASHVRLVGVMGAVSVKVPPTLRVQCDGLGLMGAFESLDQSPPNQPPDAPSLRISGVALMGAVEVVRRD